MKEVECPKCNSTKVKLVQASYPKAYECQKCKHIFLKNPKALIDE